MPLISTPRPQRKELYREIETRYPRRDSFLYYTSKVSIYLYQQQCDSINSLVNGMTGVSSASRDVRCMGLSTTMYCRDIRRAWRSGACGGQFAQYREQSQSR